MDVLFDFSSSKERTDPSTLNFLTSLQQVKSDALSSKYRHTARSKLWTSVQTDVKKKQSKMEREAEKATFVMYVDRDRGAGVSLGATDLTSELKKKKKEERFGAVQDTLEWTIYYKEALADVSRGRYEKALGLFDKEILEIKLGGHLT